MNLCEGWMDGSTVSLWIKFPSHRGWVHIGPGDSTRYRYLKLEVSGLLSAGNGKWINIFNSYRVLVPRFACSRRIESSQVLVEYRSTGSLGKKLLNIGVGSSVI